MNDLESQRNVLLNEPRPLFSKQHNLALFWSAKAGCTFAIKWFLYQVGMLESALFYSPWIHNFRVKVFYESEGYKNYMLEIFSPETRVIKFVRNPYSRAVSGYLAYCQAAYTGDPGHQAVIREIENFCGRSISQTSTFSFREFVSYLSSIDLKSCNMHYKLQLSSCEEEGLLKQVYQIDLEDSKSQVKKIEQELGLRESNVASIMKSPHHTMKKVDAEFCGDTHFFRTLNVPVPNTKHFYDEMLLEKVFLLYRSDFESYNYDRESIFAHKS